MIHENLRPEKSREAQKVGGKRKSYNLDPDNSETPEDNSATSKKSRPKKSKKVVEAVEPEIVVSREDAIGQVDKGRPSPKGRKKASILTTKPDGGTEKPKPEVVSTRKNRGVRKGSFAEVEGGEADVAKVVRKRKKPEVGDEVELPQVQVKRARKGRSGVGLLV